MLRIIHLGLGEIGKGTINALLDQGSALKLVAVVDTHPALAGRPIREVLGHSRVPDLRINPSLSDALRTRPDVATLTTGSRTVDVRPTLEQLVRAGVHVVSTCEELSYPALRARRIADQIDRLARKHRVAILGTGVNPGFAMDAFALACTAACARVRGIRVVRSLDARLRRMQLQKKVGAGMTLAAVRKLIQQNAIGHVGLGESVAMIAEGLGWKLKSIEEKFTPVIATRPVRSDFFKVQTGQVRGMRMAATGIVRGKPLIYLDLTMALGAETFDEVQIDVPPPAIPLTIRTTSGFPGDTATTAILINCARLAPHLEPGVRTMLDVLRVRSLGV